MIMDSISTTHAMAQRCLSPMMVVTRTIVERWSYQYKGSTMRREQMSWMMSWRRI
jgi:hypothetical protein